MFVSGIEAFGDDKVVLQEPHMIIFLLPRGLFLIYLIVQITRGVAQPGSAPALGAGGRRFKSSRPDQKG